MVNGIKHLLLIAGLLIHIPVFGQMGGIRGTVTDADFETPLPGVQVHISGTEQKAITGDTGDYYFDQVKSGVYTLFFGKEGYNRFIQSEVVVSPGELIEVEVPLTGLYEEMEEVVVREIQLGGETEAGLLNLRMDSASLLDSVGAKLISRAGASDAAQALNLVPGATVQGGKYAVIRGLPDRYVAVLMNGVRLPSADVEKRAVQLDQFPSAMIESIRVSKTFTPDQQGDASGGAVDVILKSVPDERVLKAGLGVEFNTQVEKASDRFLTYRGGGVSLWGKDAGERTPRQSAASWDGAVGVTREEAPSLQYKWNITAGDRHEFDSGIKAGAAASFFYKRDASYFENGLDDAYWVQRFGEPASPQYSGEEGREFTTALNDVVRGSEEVQWGLLAGMGIESERHQISALYSYTRNTEDTAALQENTRGKAHFFPGHDPDNPDSPGHSQEIQENVELRQSPYTRFHTLEYIERTADTLQLRGRHVLPFPNMGIGSFFQMHDPELAWTAASSSALLNSPDKRLFSAQWIPGYVLPPREHLDFTTFPPDLVMVPETLIHPVYEELRPRENASVGHLQRIWKRVEEESGQYFIDGSFPFEQWSGNRGSLSFGIFEDRVRREYRQASFSNADAQESQSARSEREWGAYWTDVWPDENRPLYSSPFDVEYDGKQQISARYCMIKMPLWPFIDVLGGVRHETARIETEVFPDQENPAPIYYDPRQNWDAGDLRGGAANADFKEDNLLPSFGMELKPLDRLVLRAAYSKTLARQSFKELAPVLQQEYAGGTVFAGNPTLGISSIENHDLRLDYTPYPGGLLSVSWFGKNITDPIEYRQVSLGGSFIGTVPENYPDGKMRGVEFEARIFLGRFWEALEGLHISGNYTLIKSNVSIPEEEQDALVNQGWPRRGSRHMLNAPERLYNFQAAYAAPRLGTELGLFYSVRGDTLISGAGLSGNKYVPDVYETEYGTLNFTLSQPFGDHLKLSFKAKNLTNPKIQSVYRSKYVKEGDIVKSSYTKGIDCSIELTGVW